MNIAAVTIEHLGSTRWERIKAWFVNRKRRHFGRGRPYFNGWLTFNGTKDYFVLKAWAKSEDNEDANILSSPRFSLRWEDVRDMACHECGRGIAFTEWSSVKFIYDHAKGETIERHCSECAEGGGFFRMPERG